MACSDLWNRRSPYLMFIMLFPLVGCADPLIGQPPKNGRRDLVKADKILGPWKELRERRLAWRDSRWDWPASSSECGS